LPHLYNDFVVRIARAFERALSAMEAGYGFDYGLEFEVALCKTIRRLLPQRFAVCRGYVVNRVGEMAGDDIIIFERHLFPTVRFILDEDDLLLKEQVPVEAVAAYIEAKHALELEGDTNASIEHALEQAGRVKLLCDQRQSVPLRQVSRHVNLGQGFDMHPMLGWPEKRNPGYTAIIARHVRQKKNGENIADSAAIEAAIGARAAVTSSPLPPPDLIIAGSSNVVVPCIPHGSGGSTIESPFMLPRGGSLASLRADGLAFGVGLCHLLWALDYIALGAMPWPAIMQDALGLPSTKPS